MNNTGTLYELAMLLRIKETELRESLLYQCEHAVDRGIHSGGSESALTLLTALYYGGFLRYDLENPATNDQDLFILSKGHAVAALASVYADLGYFPKEELGRSRNWGTLIKGHPGPIIPGVPVATGPLGHGISIACGYALRQKEYGGFDLYCMVGDGELQEGSCWEGLAFAGEHHLDNLCLLVDKNNGQSDDTQKLFLSQENLAARLTAFGFEVVETESSNMPHILSCLADFKRLPRCSKPFAIICETIKGYGGYSMTAAKHKASYSDQELVNERALLAHARKEKIRELARFDHNTVRTLAEGMGYALSQGGSISNTEPKAKPKRAPQRDKALVYDRGLLTGIEKGKSYGATDVALNFAQVFAADPRFWTIDADLSNVSGLFPGTGRTNRYHAINTGIAECNMMCMAEALAAAGDHVWVSTFGPFFDMRAFRRIAVSYQERQEVIEKGGWLSEGHNLDITFLSTASNIDTAVNGSTHMSNDDMVFINNLAHVKVIDCSCPRQFQAVSRWIAAGNKGLVYLRVMRSPSPALYDADFEFEYGKGYYLRKAPSPKAVLVSSGHGVLEALAAADLLEAAAFPVSVVDMPSYDAVLLRTIAESKIPLVFAEQNNGALFDSFGRDALKKDMALKKGAVHALNTRDRNDELQFIQSGSYEQIADALGLSGEKIARYVQEMPLSLG
jgi:transketolase